jgi:hypothetical protein
MNFRMISLSLYLDDPRDIVLPFFCVLFAILYIYVIFLIFNFLFPISDFLFQFYDSVSIFLKQKIEVK